ncbi:MAG: PepSY domain-containing protein [Aeromicrobium sp.]
MRKRVFVAAAGIGIAAAIAVGGVAMATSGDDGPASHQYTQQQADAATKAALEATGGGTANSVESDTENGATYEVEVSKSDGSTVDVRLDANYKVVVIEGDKEDSAGN